MAKYFSNMELLASPTTDAALDGQYLAPADRISELYDVIYQQVAELRLPSVVCKAALDKLQEAIIATEQAISLQVDHEIQKDREEREAANGI